MKVLTALSDVRPTYIIGNSNRYNCLTATSKRDFYATHPIIQ